MRQMVTDRLSNCNNWMGIYQIVTPGPQLGMTKDEVRRRQLRKIIDERFFGKVSRLAAFLDMKPPQLHRWLSGNQGIHEDSAEAMCKKLSLPRDCLDRDDDLPPLLPPSHVRRIPVVGTAQLGDNGYWSELEHPPGFGDGYIEFPTRSGSAYALRCRGDSMKPRIKDGEFVIVDPERAPVPGDEVLVKASDGRIMVKEWLYTRDGVVHLLSVNESHGKLALPLADIDAMHCVVATVKHMLCVKD